MTTILRTTFCKCIFLNLNIWIPIKISLMFISKSQINTILALEEIMAWRHPGDKPLSEPMIVNLPGYFWLADGCATN